MGQIFCAVGDISRFCFNENLDWNHYLSGESKELFDHPETYFQKNIFSFTLKIKKTKGKNILLKENHVFIWAGDIYNRKKIYELLSCCNRSDLENMDDIELVAEIYYKRGTNNFANDIIGDYVVCVVDINSSEVWCIRSPFGLHSLYYWFDKGSFVCCTSLDLIIKKLGSGFHTNSNHFFNYMSQYLATPYSGQIPLTPYENVFSLKPSYCVTYDTVSCQTKLLWVPKIIEIKYATDHEYYEHFKHLFKDALLGILNSQPNREWGLNLSGGVDSSAVACMLNQLVVNGETSIKPTLYHYHHFGSGDEIEYAKEVARYIDSELVTIPAEKSLLDFSMYRSVSTTLPSPQLFHLTKSSIIDNSSKIMLSGLGGDSILNGNPIHLANLLKKFQLITLVKQTNNMKKALESNFVSTFLSFAIKPLLPSAKTNYPTFFDTILHDNFSPRVKGAVDGASLSIPNIYSDPASQHDYKYLMEIDQWVAENSILDTARSPFLNVELVEFCLSVPGYLRHDGKRDKLMIRKSMENILPKEIVMRSTKSFVDDDIALSIKKNWAEINEITRDPILEQLNVLKPKSLRDIFILLREGSLRQIVPALSAIQLELWLRSVLRVA